MNFKSTFGIALGLLSVTCAAYAETFGIETLDVTHVEQAWGEPHANKSVEGHPLTLGGKVFDHGLGTHAQSLFRIALDGKAERFTATVGVDDEVGKRGSTIFTVSGDGKKLWESGLMHGGEPGKVVSVDLRGVRILALAVSEGGDSIDFDHADWADAQIVMAEGKPLAAASPAEPAVVLTPKPSARPRINGARIFGARPGAPFLFTVPATGDRPLTFNADNLPAGLKLDPQTGQITGMLSDKGEFQVILRVGNHVGIAKRPLKIVCGDTIALTPPLGWNSWNCFACDVSDSSVRAAADAMVSSGLIQHGWTYINIDDCWEGRRDSDGNILSNSKFPDMRDLTEYVHSKGLKMGLYSSPGPRTCARYEGSYQNEERDARRYADWGFDYLNNDWCSYGEIAPNPNHEQLLKPYQVMRAALDKAPRDIVFSLCQYGMGNVWEWGAQVGGNCWRTTGDITDTWTSMSHIGFGQAGHEKFAAPGHWNDPDMLVVGYVGWSAKVRPTRLTPNEQYTHITLWCLLSAPLLIGCDLTKLDEFTLNLLTNDEVLEVNQDSLGRQAGRVTKDGMLEVWARDLEDGAKAVGLFNRGDEATQVNVKWSDLGVTGKQAVRDLWRQKDLGSFDSEFNTQVPRHGAALVKILPAK